MIDPGTIAALMQGAGVLAGGLKAPPAAPAYSSASSPMDGSNWNVNFGSGGITSSAEKSQGDKSSELLILAVITIAGIVALKYLKR